jgi:carotenoid cleavage dioxygenase-like enzyme
MRSSNSHSYAAGFAGLDSEVSVDRLPIQGSFPEWLSGTLLRTGPAKYDLGRQTVSHWFDGLAMLHRFSFADGQVSYANKFLHSKTFRGAQEEGRLTRGGFATDPCGSLFQRVMALFSSERPDNCNVSVNALAHRAVALTETRMPICFDPETLETLGYYPIDADLAGTLSTAHPHHDAERKLQFSFLIDFGRTSRYRLFAIDDDSGTQRLVAELPVDRPAYLHSIGMGRRHLVIVEFPLVVNPLSFLLRSRPFIRNYRWQPERGVRLHVFDKDDGRRVTTGEAGAAFAFHHVNAYERGQELVVDLVAYPDADVIDQFYLARLRAAEPVDGAARLTRYVIPLAPSDKVRTEAIADRLIELPRINYARHAGEPYDAVWGVGHHRAGNFLDSIVKIEAASGRAREWLEEAAYPGEPVFVARPDAGGEDDGVLLSVVLDARRHKSFLLVLDAASLAEIARAECPHPIPFGLHGNYFPADPRQLSLAAIHR